MYQTCAEKLVLPKIAEGTRFKEFLTLLAAQVWILVHSQPADLCLLALLGFAEIVLSFSETSASRGGRWLCLQNQQLVDHHFPN